MPAELIDGNLVAAEIIADLKGDIAHLTEMSRPPHLAAIRANDDAGSRWYAKAQAEHCAEHGIQYTLAELGADASESEICAKIEEFNNNAEISAILLHLPLPRGCDYLKLVGRISPLKDAEGVHPQNLGSLLAQGYTDPAPCTAIGAVELVRRIRPELNGAKALVLGRSAIVGKPAALLLLNLNASVIIGHSRSDVPALCREAEVIIAATGAASVKWERYRRAVMNFEDGKGSKPDPVDLTPLVTAEMVRPGAIVIDVGVNHIPKGLDENGELLLNDKGKIAMQYVGDVDVPNVQKVAGYITNPKGGCGPVTNAYLLRNTVNAAKRAAGF